MDDTLAEKKRELYQAVEGIPFQQYSIYFFFFFFIICFWHCLTKQKVYLICLKSIAIKNMFQGINKGIFRLPSAKKFEIESLNLRALNAIWVSPLSGKQVPKLNPFHSSHFFSYGNGRIRTFPSQG
ncbi:uncharacterized protein DS421_14g479930 [Arachis hypogaea]|nr:uncharacterized protein DS421_14g479930 [Arachis hypogaea]